MHLKKLGISITIIFLLAACTPPPTVTPTVVPSKPSETAPVIASAAPNPTATLKAPKETAPVGETKPPKATGPANETRPPKATELPPTQQPPPTTGPGGIAPYPDASLCPDSGEAHNHNRFHTLWDDVGGCHYDHEHGQNPFSSEVAAAFPDFEVLALLGGVSVGHTNPSSAIENHHKHGGMKWNVQLLHPEGCLGFEGATNGVNGSVIQFHGFGDYAIEAEARFHSTVAFLRQCNASNPTDYGYVFVNQLQDYGQRIVPYQGTVLSYPNQPIPVYDSRRGPYLSIDCIDLTSPHVSQCRESFEQARANDASSVWTSKPTGTGSSASSPLFHLLWRVRDTYRLFNWDDQDYADGGFTFFWLCSADNGLTYNPIGCEHNNSTTQVHEVAGEIPAAWDNVAGLDSDPRVGRITAAAFVTSLGELNPSCVAPSTEKDCFPFKLVQAFTGTYGSVLVFTNKKGTNSVPIAPERDIYFCGGQVCSEGDPGATPSGWIGQNN